MQQHYDALWQQAIPAIHSGDIDIDPVLARGGPDLRRGLTLLFRPVHPVAAAISKMLEPCRACEPHQHYYSPSELHVTVLSMFTATEDHEPWMARATQYMDAVNDVVRDIRSFRIKFRGITASRAAVMVQGFPETNTLEQLRDRLRRELEERGLSEGLDKRYRLVTAHMTVIRFRAPLANPRHFAELLNKARDEDFGETQVKTMSLMRGDWYLSEAVQQQIAGWELQS